MHHHYLRKITALLEANLVSLALLDFEPHSSASVEELTDDKLAVTRLHLHRYPLFGQNCSLEVHIILAPVDIQNGLDLLIVFWLQDEVTRPV